MANMKQQIKRYKNDNAKHAANSAYKAGLRTLIKNVVMACEAGDKEAAVVALNKANSRLDASVTKGIHHKNYAAKQKARLAKKVNSIA